MRYLVMGAAGASAIIAGWLVVRHRLASWLVIVVSLAIDNRLRSGPVSFTVGELGALVFIAASLFRQPSAAWRIRRDHLSLLLIMATSAAIAWSRDPDAVHALSAVRDVFLPI